MEFPSKADNALDLIQWPFRILLTGPSGAGKSTVAIQIMEEFKNTIDRIIVVSPTFLLQEIFRPLDCLIKNVKRDVFPSITKTTFARISKQIQRQYEYCKVNQLDQIRTVVFIDDNTSNNAIHGGRMGSLGNLTIMCRHFDASLLCISHQGKAITPGFRNNVTSLIAFPTNIENEINFITQEFGNPILWTRDEFKKIISHAWKGGREDMREWGRHFLFILTPARSYSRYFIDFKQEIIYYDDDANQGF